MTQSQVLQQIDRIEQEFAAEWGPQAFDDLVQAARRVEEARERKLPQPTWPLFVQEAQ